MNDEEGLVAATLVLGEAVRAARVYRGWTHRKLAERLDVPMDGLRHVIERLEAGQGVWSEPLEASLMRVLRLDPSLVASGARASRVLAWRRLCVSEPVDLKNPHWVDAPLMSVHALVLIEAWPEIRERPEWANLFLPFAYFGGPLYAPKRPATLGELVGAWSEGYLTYHHAEDPSTLWRRFAQAGGYLKFGSSYGFLEGGPVCALYTRGMSVVAPGGPSFPWPETNAIDPAHRERAASWTLRRVLGPEGLGVMPTLH